MFVSQLVPLNVNWDSHYLVLKVSHKLSDVGAIRISMPIDEKLN